MRRGRNAPGTDTPQTAYSSAISGPGTDTFSPLLPPSPPFSPLLPPSLTSFEKIRFKHHSSYMPRSSRIVAPGHFHHITQRGNNRQVVFLSESDRGDYLIQLRRAAILEGVRLIGYCLMTNHVHLVVCPDRADALGRFLRRAHGEYSRLYNARHRRTGHLWQNRFYSCVLEGSHVLSCLRYVDLNPVRARMVNTAVDWRWSSAKAHVAGLTDEFKLITTEWLDWREWPNWAECLALGQQEHEIRNLRERTRRNQPMGSERFVNEVVEQWKSSRAALAVAKSQPKTTTFAA